MGPEQEQLGAQAATDLAGIAAVAGWTVLSELAV